ncbi:MAG: CRISPR-associated helicase Cas3', partial [Bacteroidota bacterium]
PLWAHLLDVAHTALLLWEGYMPASLKRTVATALDLSEDETGRWLALQIGLHDLGKAIPSFQIADERAPHVRALREQGFSLTGDPEPRLHHGHATIALLYRALPEDERTRSTPGFHETLYATVGFHHSALTHRAAWKRWAHEEALELGGPAWREQQTRLLDAVVNAWTSRYGNAAPGYDVPAFSPWMLAIAGWATTADWLGSMASAFPTEVPEEPSAYIDDSLAGAQQAVERAGFQHPARLTAKPFAKLFPELATYAPRPVQQRLIDLPLPTDPNAPTLTIVEAPTGEGKTEGALALAARQQAASGPGGGLYLALPTKATANGLLPRTLAFLEQAHDGPAASFRLAYGRSELHEDARALVTSTADLLDVSDDDGREGAYDRVESRVHTLRWFLTSKRALLAPYGLGTVDQALLGGLYARHFFLRLFGLAGKTVVVDEVHAYDVYTGRLVLDLLPWLRALGCHVVLLSATLPARLRDDLLRAWDGRAWMPTSSPDTSQIGYPAVWLSAEGHVRIWAGVGDGLTANRTQHAALERGDPAPEQIAARVRDAVEADAVVAVVCNTVKRAQEVFRTVEAEVGALLGEDDLCLLHGRFVQQDRVRIERHVVGHRDEAGTWIPGRFGKGRPSGPAVLVGTQVIEQSLDLDVDLMLSDLAPIDLLLQRAGRLHRHDRSDRPVAYGMPRLVWLCPDWEVGGLADVDDLSGGGYVYRRTVLWRTAQLLRNRETTGWSLPADYRPLIEAVYGIVGVPPDLSAEAAQTWRTWEQREEEKATNSDRNAKDRTVYAPNKLYKLFVSGRRLQYDEDDETAAQAVRAATREGESVEVVVLHAGPDGRLYLDPALEQPAPLMLPRADRPLPTDDVRALLGASVRLSQKGVVTHFQQQDA